MVLMVGQGGSYSWYHAFATQEREIYIYRGGETEENCLRKKDVLVLKDQFSSQAGIYRQKD